MRESVFETLIGLAVLTVTAVFLWFAVAQGGDAAPAKSNVEIGVRFNSASGIDRGTDVRMAGVKIGAVRDIQLDVDRAEAKVVMNVDSRIMPLGDGTTARVQSESLLGGSYISLEPAEGFGEIIACSDDEALFGETGCGEILYAQGSIDLMTLFASFASGNGSDSSSETSSSSADDDFPSFEIEGEE